MMKMLYDVILLRESPGAVMLRNLDAELHHARVEVIRRYARGNVSFQNGNILDDESFEDLLGRGDEAVDFLLAQEEGGHH